ncbi:MAG: AAA family ATPase [Candidatus Paceibacterota bacterium]|jgi:AAA15 family ATPase/GTPase
MNYSKFTVKNFRCFTEEQTLQLAQPEVGKIGSGITYIVGANNSGKTTIIESLWIKKGHYLNDSERKAELPEFKLYSTDTTLKKTVKLLRANAYLFIEDPDRESSQNIDLFEIVSSRRHWESVANGTDTSNNIVAGSAIGGNPRNQQNVQTAIFLKAIETDSVKYNDFTNLVKRVIPEFTGWAVGFETQPYIKYISSDGTNHKADFLGDGVISIIRIMAHLFENRNTGLIIDEPELSLHPLAQKRLIKLIAEYAQKRQIIISTHSPYFVNWEYIANGAKLNRVTKAGDTNSKIFTLGDSSKYSNLINGANWQQPFLMDEVAKEIFFANDKILFLEGQEDVGLLRNEFIDTDIHLFGYGVRGCDNFKFALSMAKDLGFEKVGIIIDKGSKEDLILAELTPIFNTYKIIQWNKSDIRDKTQITYIAKDGYFNQDGNKKSAEFLDDYEEKINIVKSYYK